MKCNSFAHVTMNSGHLRQSWRTEVRDEVVDQLRGVARAGGPIPGLAQYGVRVTHADGAALFSVGRHGRALVTCGLAWTEDAGRALWWDLRQTFRSVFCFGPPCERPERLPWLAVIVWPELLMELTRCQVVWLGDFERCFVWTLLEEGMQ